MRNWVNARTSFPCNFNIAFYPGRYAHEKMSILPGRGPHRVHPRQRGAPRLTLTGSEDDCSTCVHLCPS